MPPTLGVSWMEAVALYFSLPVEVRRASPIGDLLEAGRTRRLTKDESKQVNAWAVEVRAAQQQVQPRDATARTLPTSLRPFAIADLDRHAYRLESLADEIGVTLSYPGCSGSLARHLVLTQNNVRFEAQVLRRAAEIAGKHRAADLKRAAALGRGEYVAGED